MRGENFGISLLSALTSSIIVFFVFLFFLTLFLVIHNAGAVNGARTRFIRVPDIPVHQ